MKPLRRVFSVIMTLLIVMVVYLMFDAVAMGAISLFIAMFNGETALQVFKAGVLLLFGTEFLFTIPAIVQMFREGEEE